MLEVAKHGELRYCLDHGFVRLVDSMGSDESIIRAARVSYDEDGKTGTDKEGDIKLLNYLWKNHHSTPFESCTVTLEIKAPIFIFRQWHRHRTWSYNELSSRYRPLPDEFYIPDPLLIGKQSKSSKQARTIDEIDKFELNARQNECELLRKQCEASYRTYEALLQSGWPKELARSILPVNIYSHMFATVNLLNLFKFLTLRYHSHAQYEIQVYAQAIIDLIRPVFPEAVRAWESTHKKD